MPDELDEFLKRLQGGVSPTPVSTTSDGLDSFIGKMTGVQPQAPFQPVADPVKRAAEQQEIGTLQGSNQARIQQIESRGGESPDLDEPGILSRIFDVLQRPNYAVAEVSSRLLDPNVSKPLGRAGIAQFLNPEVVGGALSGLSGRSKTTFSDVLEEQGVENRFVKGIGGLGLDIAFDPTTYVGIGVVGKIGQVGKAGKFVKGGKVALDEVGADAARRALQSGAATKHANKVAKEALSQAAVKGKGATKTIDVKKITQQAKTDYILGKQAAAKTKAATEQAKKLQFKFMGKPVFTSEGAYQGIAKVGDLIMKTPVLGKPGAGLSEGLLQTVNKGFRTAAAFPGELNFVKRMLEGRGSGDFHKWVADWRKMTSGLTEDEASRVAYAIEDSVDLTGEVGKHGADLGAIQRAVKAINEDLFESEAFEMGIVGAEKWLPNYVYHIYKTTNKKAIAKFEGKRAKIVGPQNPDFIEARKIASLKEAEVAGLKPLTDIREIMSRRVEKHFKVKARYEFENKLVTDYGLSYKNAADVDNALMKKLGYEQVKSPYLKNEFAYVPETIAEVFNKTQQIISNDKASAEFLQFFDKVQNTWKFIATVVNPGHHIRNAVGDITLGYYDGVTNPYRYEQARKVVFGGGRDVPFVKIGNQNLTPDDVMNAYIRYGQKAGFTRSEFGRGRVKGVAVELTEKIRDVSERREDWARLAHFIDSWTKEAKGIKAGTKALVQMDEAAQRAAQRVAHWHIDYGDFTEFETTAMKRAIPFYSFMRKNIPLQLEAIAMRPSKVLPLPKGQRAIETLLGVPQRDAQTEETYPQWLKELAPFNVSEDLAFTMGLPIQDIADISPIYTAEGAGNTMRRILSSIRPEAQFAIETGTDSEVFTGGQRTTGIGYAAEYFPIARLVSQLVDPSVNKQTKQDKVINYLTGAGLQRITPQRRMSELRRREDVIQGVLNELTKKEREEIFGRE